MESKFHMKQIMVEQEYEVPKDEFEEVIKTYLPFSNSEIEKGTFYNI